MLSHQTRSFSLTFALALGIGSAACTTPAGHKTAQEAEQVSLPSTESPFTKILQENNKNIETIVILGTNDMHGALAPEAAKTHEQSGVPPIAYEKGGATILAAHVKNLRDEFGSRLVVLDAGDQFQGSIESNLEAGAPVTQLMNAIGVQAAAIGNHEFDFGPGTEAASSPAAASILPVTSPSGRPLPSPSAISATDPLGSLKRRLGESEFPYVSANIISKKTKTLPDLPNTHPHVVLDAGKLKVGIIGLTTLDTPVSTRPEFIQDLTFTDMKKATIKEASAARHEGADVVVLVAHVGLKCASSRHGPGLLWKKSDPAGACGEKDELVRLLKSLPPGTVDAVVSGHSHQIVHHWVAGVPVVQGGTRNQYFSLMYLNFDVSKKKILEDRTLIEGPIPICGKIFENQGDCNGDRPAPKAGRGPLVTPVFHGNKIVADRQVTAILDPIFEKTADEKKRVIGHASRPISHDRNKESELGNLVADAMRAQLKTDAALINAGGLRAPLEQGDITYGEIFRTLPFENSVVVLTVTGRELKNILRVAESGARGFFPVSGLTLRLIDPIHDAPANDLNQDHRIEPWEINRLVEARLSDGTEVKDDQKYTLATVDFLVQGGDDMGWSMAQIPSQRIKVGASGIIRDVVIQYLKSNDPINTVNHPLVEPGHPRFIFEAPKLKKTGGKRRKRSAHGRRKHAFLELPTLRPRVQSC